MMIGRPENNNTRRFVTRLHTSETSVASVLLSARVLVSPLPSAHGVSPPATIPTSPLSYPFVRVPTKISFTADESPACSIAYHTVLPTVAVLLPPCHANAQ